MSHARGRGHACRGPLCAAAWGMWACSVRPDGKSNVGDSASNTVSHVAFERYYISMSVVFQYLARHEPCALADVVEAAKLVDGSVALARYVAQSLAAAHLVVANGLAGASVRALILVAYWSNHKLVPLSKIGAKPIHSSVTASRIAPKLPKCRS